MGTSDAYFTEYCWIVLASMWQKMAEGVVCEERGHETAGVDVQRVHQ